MVDLFDMLFEKDCLMMIIERSLDCSLNVRIEVKFEDK